MREQLPFFRGSAFSFAKGRLALLLGFFVFICLPNSISAAPHSVSHNFFLDKSKDLKSSIIESEAFNSILLPCPGGSGVIGGRAIGDYNFNGIDDEIGGVRGVTVFIYSCDPAGQSTLVGTTITDYDGHYFFDGLTDGTQYKVEFEADPALFPGFIGGDFGSDVQFVTAPTCGINTSFASAEDFAQANPTMYSTCFINGDPLAANANGADAEVLVSFPWNSQGSSVPPTKIGTAGQYGSIYGIAQDRFDDYLFTSAFLKRHCGLGPEGLGGIYVLDINGTPSPLLSMDLTSLGLNFGSIPSNSARGLNASVNLPSNDPDAYPNIGKIGIGGIEVDYNGDYLYVVNLFENALHRIDIRNLPATPTAGDVTTYNLPTNGCSGGNFRPFAVKYYQGNIYVGGVCDAGASGLRSDLTATIYRLDGTTFNSIANFSLDYDKGYTTLHSDCENYPGWYGWVDTPPAFCDNGSTIVYPQPILSDFEFDVDGSLIIGLMDRNGHQLGYENYLPTGTDLVSTVSGGDLLRVYLEDDGTYTLESNGTAGAFTTGGSGNGQGPGGGEFYYNDVFQGGLNNITPAPHAETSQGGIAFNRGTGDIATTALDPYSIAFNTGGVNWFNNQNVDIRNQEGYRLYRTSSSNNATFAKANGLGDLLIHHSLAPIQIGGLAWVDENDDGVQDGCEDVLSGIEVSLFDENGDLITTTTTGANGEYFFNDGDIETFTKYFVVFGTNGEYNTFTGQINNAYFITADDEGAGTSPDRNDSDITAASAGMGGGNFTNMPFIMLTTGGDGYVDHSFDAGFTPEGFIAPPAAGVGDFVWEDTDRDGVQDANEPPISGVTVTLLDGNGNVIATTMTGPDGRYLFPSVEAGTYCIQFGIPAGLSGTVQDNGANDMEDSDVNPLTGKTPNFVFDPLNGDDLSFDAGFVTPVTAGIGDFVWEDTDRDGVQDANEPPISGVTVTLLDGNGNVIETTTTGPDGRYLFTNIPAGTYCIQFGTPAGLSGTTQNSGADDANDSDIDPNTGKTPNFVFEPLNGDDLSFDAGFVTPIGNCTGADIQGFDITPACGAVGGTATALINGDATDYEYIWLPNRGNQTTDRNYRTDLPIGTYLLIIQHVTDPDCNDKQYFTITDDCLTFPDSTIFTMEPGETKELCPTFEYLIGENISTNARCVSGCELSTFASEGVGECLTLEAKRTGTQIIAFEGCNENNECEKEVLIINISRDISVAEPVAVKDEYHTTYDKAITFDVCLNDEIVGPMTNLMIIEKPQHGLVKMDRQAIMTYEPSENHCGEDFFTYQICTDGGCDMATVKIMVECDKVLPVGGFSPNGDGINDQFNVVGIEQFENEVSVFNRYGHLVFNKKQYENNWEGDFNGTPLPSGVYYYVINFDGNKTTGYVVINR